MKERVVVDGRITVRLYCNLKKIDEMPPEECAVFFQNLQI